MNTQKWNYTKGLHELGNGCYAYLQPDGGWGWSNAGLVADAGRRGEPRLYRGIVCWENSHEE